MSQQLRSVVSSLFNADVLHDAARTRFLPALMQQQQQQGQLSGQQQAGQPNQQQKVIHTWIADMFKVRH
jgi:hypothetical protein